MLIAAPLSAQVPDDPVGILVAEQIADFDDRIRIQFTTTATCDDYRWQGDYMASGKFTEGASTRLTVPKISRAMLRTATIYCASEDRSQWSVNGLSATYTVDARGSAPPPADTLLAARLDSLDARVRRLFGNDSTLVGILNGLGARTDSVGDAHRSEWDAQSARIDTLHPITVLPPPTGDTATMIAEDSTTQTWVGTWTSDPTAIDEIFETRETAPRENRFGAASPDTVVVQKLPEPRLFTIRIERDYGPPLEGDERWRLQILWQGTIPAADTTGTPPPTGGACAIGDRACRTIQPTPALPANLAAHPNGGGSWEWCTHLGGFWLPWHPASSCYSIP